MASQPSNSTTRGIRASATTPPPPNMAILDRHAGGTMEDTSNQSKNLPQHTPHPSNGTLRAEDRADSAINIDATDSSLHEYTSVKVLPSGVKILKKGNDKGEPGGSVAKLMGKISSKNILKQKAKKKDKDVCPASLKSSKEKSKHERSKHKKNAGLNNNNQEIASSPFKLPKPHYHHHHHHHHHHHSNHVKETSQGEISFQLQTSHPLTMQRLSTPASNVALTSTLSAPICAEDNLTLSNDKNSNQNWWKEMKVLIHLIDGFEIEESDSPFPIAQEALADDAEEPVDVGRRKQPEEGRGCADDELSAARISRSGVDGNHSATAHTEEASMEPPAKAAKHFATSVASPEVKRETMESPTKTGVDSKNQPAMAATENKAAGYNDEEEEDDEEDDSISIGSKELVNQEEMMNVDYASSPPSHSPVSFPLRDVSSTDSFPSHHHLDNELVDEKPAIFLCEPDVDKNIVDWTEQDVYHFISGIEGCSQYAEEFISQEIDGQALVLLNEDHLMSNLNVKLGPALKILAKIQENKK